MVLDKKKTLKTLGDRLSFAIVLNFYIWLFVAMLNGHQVAIYFNHFGEAILEYIIYISIFPIIVYALYVDIKNFRKKIKGKRIKFCLRPFKKKRTQQIQQDYNEIFNRYPKQKGGER